MYFGGRTNRNICWDLICWFVGGGEPRIKDIFLDWAIIWALEPHMVRQESRGNRWLKQQQNLGWPAPTWPPCQEQDLWQSRSSISPLSPFLDSPSSQVCFIVWLILWTWLRFSGYSSLATLWPNAKRHHLSPAHCGEVIVTFPGQGHQRAGSPLSTKSRPPPVPTPVLHFPAAHERTGAWLKLLIEQREEGRRKGRGGHCLYCPTGFWSSSGGGKGFTSIINRVSIKDLIYSSIWNILQWKLLSDAACTVLWTMHILPYCFQKTWYAHDW